MGPEISSLLRPWLAGHRSTRRCSIERRPAFGISYRGISLLDLKLRPGPWKIRGRLLEMQAAARWGKTPTEFWELGPDDQAYMLALVLIEAKMQAWDSQQAEDERKRASKHA